MDYARRSPSSSDSCDDLPDLISPEDIDKLRLLDSLSWQLTTDSLATNEVTYAWTRTAMLLLEVRAYMLQKYPYFKRTGEWKSLLVHSKIKYKL